MVDCDLIINQSEDDFFWARIFFSALTMIANESHVQAVIFGRIYHQSDSTALTIVLSNHLSNACTLQKSVGGSGNLPFDRSIHAHFCPPVCLLIYPI